MKPRIYRALTMLSLILAGETVFLENAGGSQVPRSVADAIHRYLLESAEEVLIQSNLPDYLESVLLCSDSCHILYP